jgi:UDP-N-acetylglucosamine:LPS N-acetylglucosamine transferase
MSAARTGTDEIDDSEVERLLAAGRGPILMAASSGGHLAQLLALRTWWGDRPRVWVTFPTADAKSQLKGERVTWAYYPTTRNLPNLVRNTWLAVRLLRKEKPSVVVSTGAAVAVPFFVLCWLRGIPTVYLEVYDRIDSPTLTGRLVRPFTRLFLVQWEEQRKYYPGSVVVGPLL